MDRAQRVAFHLLSNRISRKIFVNGKQPTCNFVAIGAIAQFWQFVGEFCELKFVANAAKFINGKNNLSSCVLTPKIKRGQKLDLSDK